jgi:hypothetical protein
MALRSAMHQAGAAALTELLKFDPPDPEQRQWPCPCGHMAHYVELRSKSVLTAVGEAESLRPYFLCDHCHRGQFPIDVELDINSGRSQQLDGAMELISVGIKSPVPDVLVFVVITKAQVDATVNFFDQLALVFTVLRHSFLL